MPRYGGCKAESFNNPLGAGLRPCPDGPAVHEQPRKTVRSARNFVVGQPFGAAAGLPPGAELSSQLVTSATLSPVTMRTAFSTQRWAEWGNGPYPIRIHRVYPRPATVSPFQRLLDYAFALSRSANFFRNFCTFGDTTKAQ